MVKTYDPPLCSDCADATHLVPEILPTVAEHADIETMAILSSVQPLRVSYNISWDSVQANRDALETRRDYDEKLGVAFDELIAIVRAELEETRSIDSMLESGLFLSARTSFHSEIAGAMSTLGSIDITDSDESEIEWEDTREGMRSPTTSSTSEQAQSPTSPKSNGHFALPRATAGDHRHNLAASSPLRREVSH